MFQITHFNLSKHSIFLSEPSLVKAPFNWIGHIPFAFFIVSLIKPKIIVELGVHSGNSYNAYCQAVKELALDTLCYGVDTWQGDEQAGFYNEDIFNELSNYQYINYSSFSSLLKMTFDEALNSFSDSSIGLLHLDGCHHYETVKHDFESWLPKMQKDGVIILHDTSERSSGFGVWRLWEEIKEKYSTIEFTHSHGLGAVFLGYKNEETYHLISNFNEDAFMKNLFERLGIIIKKNVEQNVHINSLEISLVQKHQELLQNEQAITVRDQLLEQKEQTLSHKDQLLEQKEQAISYRDQLLGQKEQAISYRDQLLGQKEQAISYRDQLLGQKEQVLTDMNQLLKHKDEIISQKDEILSQKDLHIVQKEHMVQEIVNSKSWKLTAPLRLVGFTIRIIANRFVIAWIHLNTIIKMNFGKKIKNFWTKIKVQGIVDTHCHYDLWLKKNTLTEEDHKRISININNLTYKPLISIILPVYDIEEKWLRKCIESVRGQLYSNWQLCIADDASQKPHIRIVLEEYMAADNRIKVIFREINGHISAASNSALSIAEGEFIALLDHDDELTIDALYENVLLLNEHPEADMIYSDEDKIDEKDRRHSPFFKPDWSPDTFLSQMYTCHFGIYRTRLVKEIGGFREGFEGSQDYDLVLRLTEKTKNIFHIPKVLYHWRMLKGSTSLNSEAKNYAYEAGYKAIQEALKRRGEGGVVEYINNYPGQYRVSYPLKNHPKLSIIIPAKDHSDITDLCLQSIFLNNYDDFEVIIVDNASINENTFKVYNKWKQKGKVLITHNYDDSFNFSRLVNQGVELAKGELLLLLNNDTKMINDNSLQEMAGYAVRNSIGAVGSMLLYENGTIQHAGVILGIAGPANHSHRGVESISPGYFGRLLIASNCSAVTGACLMVKKLLYQKMGGFDEKLAIAYNDVDFCLKLMTYGFYNVILPFVKIYHYESLTRGFDISVEKQNRLIKEADIMRNRWGEILKRDPFYNPNLTLDREDFSIKL